VNVAPSFAEDGKWHCTYQEQGKSWVTEVTVAGGKVLQVMPNGERQIPDQVIDLGREVHWEYGQIQDFALDIDAATLENRTYLDTEMLYSCTRLK